LNFQPLVPLSGYSGWKFFERTLDQQQSAFDQSQPIKRVTDKFREEIGKVIKAEDLVNDRDLLSVALGAFGLGADIDNKFFIQKILEDGTTDDAALSNRLADSRYADFSRAFGFGDFAQPSTTMDIFTDDIISRFERQSFEAAVGEQDNQLRLALNVEAAIDDVTSAAKSQNAQWFTLLGNAPLREVIQTALGLPSEIASVDLDKQLEIFKDRAESVFGTDIISDFKEPETQENIIRLFLVRSSISNAAGFSSGSIALTLLGVR
jgi:hypothetical protein